MSALVCHGCGRISLAFVMSLSKEGELRLLCLECDRRLRWYFVYKRNDEPEGVLTEDPALLSREGFATRGEAGHATKALFAKMCLVMLRGRYSGVIVAIRRPGANEWSSILGEPVATERRSD